MLSHFIGPIFEVLAGPNRTSFLAHASILEKCAKLRVVVNGEWKDSLKRQIVLQDWDPETVARLLEWLYTGDYESPYPTESAGFGFSAQSVPSKQKWKGPSSGPETSGRAKGSQRPLTPLADICFNKAGSEIVPNKAEAFKQWTATFKRTPCILDFEATMLAHAKLYTLADYMLLPTLQAQAFQHLKTLLMFISAPTHTSPSGLTVSNLPLANKPVIDNLLTLVRYVYANTATLESEEEPLRELISTFIALHYEQFHDEKGEVSSFMEQGGDFHGDVHDKVRRNQLALKKELDVVKKELSRAEIKDSPIERYG